MLGGAAVVFEHPALLKDGARDVSAEPVVVFVNDVARDLRLSPRGRYRHPSCRPCRPSSEWWSRGCPLSVSRLLGCSRWLRGAAAAALHGSTERLRSAMLPGSAERPRSSPLRGSTEQPVSPALRTSIERPRSPALRGSTERLRMPNRPPPLGSRATLLQDPSPSTMLSRPALEVLLPSDLPRALPDCAAVLACPLLLPCVLAVFPADDCSRLASALPALHLRSRWTSSKGRAL